MVKSTFIPSASQCASQCVNGQQRLTVLCLLAISVSLLQADALRHIRRQLVTSYILYIYTAIDSAVGDISRTTYYSCVCAKHVYMHCLRYILSGDKRKSIGKIPNNLLFKFNPRCRCSGVTLRFYYRTITIFPQLNNVFSCLNLLLGVTARDFKIPSYCNMFLFTLRSYLKFSILKECYTYLQ